MASRAVEIEIEKRIIRRVAKALIKDGYTIDVNDGGEVVLKDSTDLNAIKRVMFTTDEDHFIVRKPGERAKFVTFIYGNGEDVISDYSSSLESVMDPITKWIDRGMKG